MRSLPAALLVLISAWSVLRAGELRVAAAASLADAVTEISEAYETRHGSEVTPVFAGSSALGRQIEAGAPVDVFLSANHAVMDRLVERGLVEDVGPLLTNALVVVVPSGSEVEMEETADLLEVRRIAIGDPEAVPAGVYARKWLSDQGLWRRLARRCVGCEHARAALAVVEHGHVDAAVVYRTDAAASEKVEVVWTVPPEAGPRIEYPAARCIGSGHSEAAGFLAFLRSEAARGIFEAHGFGLVGEK